MVATGTSGLRRRLLAAVAATITAADAGIYLWLIAQQGSDGPAWWFVAGLCTATLLGGYGTLRKAPWQDVALGVGGAILLALGVLGILSVGIASPRCRTLPLDRRSAKGINTLPEPAGVETP